MKLVYCITDVEIDGVKYPAGSENVRVRDDKAYEWLKDQKSVVDQPPPAPKAAEQVQVTTNQVKR